VVPQGSPAAAQQEVATVQKALGAANGSIVTTLGDLLKLLKAGDFSLLHFASHNVADPNATGGLYVPFGKSKFDYSFTGKWKSKQFRSQLPLVFMNACTSGGTVPLYTSLATWADRFVDCGSGAFIGSLWEIRDASAMTFATTFYEAFAGGRNLGESMSAAKRSLKGSDPTRLAYTLYGNPLARLS
jgi:CHAT domain-containing protein